jgi:alkylation response protein AidB-like acyl-CoA dehydrogenase
MQFQDSPQEAAFRGEVRGFIAANMPDAFHSPAFQRRFREEGVLARGEPLLDGWRANLAERGWIAPHWPREYGGAGLSTIEQFIFNEEMAEAGAPDVGVIGVQLIGPTLVLYGSEEQKRRHLPGIASGTVAWCQGYSEPGAGSDLASLQTRAVRDGDDFIINGQKIWTSEAHHAAWMFLLARTDPEAPKHRGISMFLLNMKTPGITVRPLINMAGQHGFNEVFFEDVRVPAVNMVGEENRGWYVGATLLDFERSLIRRVVELRRAVNELVELARERQDGARPGGRHAVRHELAERLVEAAVARLLSQRVISMQKRGLVPNYEASMNKLFFSETEQRVARTGLKLIGLHGGLYEGEARAPLHGRLAFMYLRRVPVTIAGGTSEIQRNVIATRGLGLPRG